MNLPIGMPTIFREYFSELEIYETNNKKGKIAGVVGGLAYQLPEEAVPMSKDIERGIRKVASNVFKKFTNRLP